MRGALAAALALAQEALGDAEAAPVPLPPTPELSVGWLEALPLPLSVLLPSRLGVGAALSDAPALAVAAALPVGELPLLPLLVAVLRGDWELSEEGEFGLCVAPGEALALREGRALLVALLLAAAEKLVALQLAGCDEEARGVAVAARKGEPEEGGELVAAPLAVGAEGVGSAEPLALAQPDSEGVGGAEFESHAGVPEAGAVSVAGSTVDVESSVIVCVAGAEGVAVALGLMLGDLLCCGLREGLNEPEALELSEPSSEEVGGAEIVEAGEFEASAVAVSAAPVPVASKETLAAPLAVGAVGVGWAVKVAPVVPETDAVSVAAASEAVERSVTVCV